MADETTQDATQAVETAQAATETTSTETTTARTPEDLEAEIKKLRQEAANYRTKAKEGEAAKAELDKMRAAEMSESEKREARIKELEAENQSALAKARIATARAKASELGFVDSSDVKLLDSIPDDEDELESALKGLLKSKPYLAKEKGSGIPSTERGGNPGGDAEQASATKQQKDILGRNGFLSKMAAAQKQV